MVDAGEEPDHAAQREFLEEAMNSDNLEKKDLENITQMVAKIFSRAKKVSFSGLMLKIQNYFSNVFFFYIFSFD